MSQTDRHSNALRRRVVIAFFAGLLILALITIAIGLACKVAGCWGTFDFGWINIVLGAAMVIGGFALVTWSVSIQYTLGKGTPAPRVATQCLVTQGPYAWLRNPMTLGALYFYLGLGVWQGAGLVILLTVMVFSALLTYIYVHESRELTERFGPEYVAYKKRTPFLIPCADLWAKPMRTVNRK